MEDSHLPGWADTGQMTFASGYELPFTKTPANVPANYTRTNNASSATGPATSSPPHPPHPPSTATKRKRKSQPPKRRKRRARPPTAPDAHAPAHAIPASPAQCTPADRMLLARRDAGADWKAIRAEWARLTGEQTGVSTLPNRYERLKTSFTAIRAEDRARLLAAKREVEEAFEGRKWELVGRVVREKGGDVYDAVVLKRQYKKLMLSGGVQPPPGVRDADFEIPGEGLIDDDDGSDADADGEMEDEE